MLRWKVSLVGDHSALDYLSWQEGQNGWSITREDDTYVLTSSEFEALTDSNEVRERAIRLLDSVAGAVSLQLGGHYGFSVANITRLDLEGGRIQQHTLSAGASVALIDEAGLAARQHPLDPSWVACAGRNQRVEKALRLWHQEPTWVNLYRVYEVIEEGLLLRAGKDLAQQGSEDAAMNIIEQRGWASKTRISAFRDIANDVALIGDEARHGHATRKSLKRSRIQGMAGPQGMMMTVREAEQLIETLLKHWLPAECTTGTTP